MRFMKKMLLLLLTVAMLGGCTANPVGEPSSSLFSAQPESSTSSEVSDYFTESPIDDPLPDPIPGDGQIIGEEADGLTAAQQKLLLDFMHRCYQSIGTLTPQDCGDLFSSSSQAASHRTVWERLSTIRKSALVDLSLLDYHFTLDCTQVEEKDDSVQIRVLESSVMHFAATPDVDSEIFQMTHSFTLTGNEEDGWKISRHMPWDSAYYGRQSSTAGALEDLKQRQDQLNLTAEETVLTWQYNYDRQAAAAYALQWAEQRNGNWSAYDRSGGNCMNYVSQAIHAGGVPMDSYGYSWYWYGDGNRVPSWSSVESFADYAENNSGYGMVCDPDANYYAGEPGDVILMSTDRYRHVVMISDVITDENGRTVDYLICSNTANYRNFPVGAYHYTNQRLIKIYGWNT